MLTLIMNLVIYLDTLFAEWLANESLCASRLNTFAVSVFLSLTRVPLRIHVNYYINCIRVYCEVCKICSSSCAIKLFVPIDEIDLTFEMQFKIENLLMIVWSFSSRDERKY